VWRGQGPGAKNMEGSKARPFACVKERLILFCPFLSFPEKIQKA